MKIGVFAKTFPGRTPDAVLRQSAAAGFEGVQYNMACSGLATMPDAIAPDAARAVATASQVTGQQVFAVSGTYNMIHADPAVRRAGERRLAVIAAACRDMGTSLVTLCTGTRDAEDQWRHHPENASAETWRDLLKSFEVAVRIAEDHGILLGVEPELANVVSSATAARRLIDEMGSRAIRIVLDPANLAERAEPLERRRIIEQSVDLLAGDIVMAHAKDRAEDGSVATAGKGVIDFGHFLSRLKSAGFDGPIVAHGFEAGEAADVARFLHAQRAALPA
jgi:sugar phosphate isomerase/epimerase